MQTTWKNLHILTSQSSSKWPGHHPRQNYSHTCGIKEIVQTLCCFLFYKGERYASSNRELAFLGYLKASSNFFFLRSDFNKGTYFSTPLKWFRSSVSISDVKVRIAKNLMVRRAGPAGYLQASVCCWTKFRIVPIRFEIHAAKRTLSFVFTAFVNTLQKKIHFSREIHRQDWQGTPDTKKSSLEDIFHISQFI